jgi:hypothetical protein
LARTYNFRSGLTTHQPVLFAVAEACDGPIAECGCGDGSTRFLHEVAERRGIRLVSFETHAEWMARFAELASAQHEFRLVDDWRSELKRPEWGERWGLVFVDQEHWVDRIPTIERVAATADYVVVHDSDASTNHGIGRSIRPLNGPHDRGERDYSDVFSSWQEFFRPSPGRTSSRGRRRSSAATATTWMRSTSTTTVTCRSGGAPAGTRVGSCRRRRGC